MVIDGCLVIKKNNKSYLWDGPMTEDINGCFVI